VIMTPQTVLQFPPHTSTQDQILRHYLKSPLIPDFYLSTDGAGYDGDYGGAASYGISPKHNKIFHRVAGYSGVSTDRAEFLALLNGLHGVMSELNWFVKARLLKLQDRPGQVVWFTDRASLAGSVNKEFSRKNQPDLWPQFNWYERYIIVHAVHVKRDTLSWQCKTDILASEARVLMRDYDQMMIENNYI